jgi:hypothetical protein
MSALAERAAGVTPLRKAEGGDAAAGSDAGDGGAATTVADSSAAAAGGGAGSLPTLLGQDIRQLVRHHQAGGNMSEFGRDGSTPLQRACEGGHLECVLYLLQVGRVPSF